jgi:hypothetical protein
MYNSLKDRAKEGGYQQSMKLLPAVSNKSDLYQLGLLVAELLFSKRLWARGDKVSHAVLQAHMEESNCTKETTSFILEKVLELTAAKPEERRSLYDIIPEIL